MLSFMLMPWKYLTTLHELSETCRIVVVNPGNRCDFRPRSLERRGDADLKCAPLRRPTLRHYVISA